MNYSRLLLYSITIIWISGCGTSESPSQGTPGVLLINANPVPNVLVTVYSMDVNPIQQVAKGVSGADGRFELFEETSLQGVSLKPGEYRITIESVGEYQLQWDKIYGSSERSPLALVWNSDDQELTLNLPEPKLLN